jgi:hypothetical protein
MKSGKLVFSPTVTGRFGGQISDSPTLAFTLRSFWHILSWFLKSEKMPFSFFQK